MTDIIDNRYLDGLYYDAQIGDIVSFTHDTEAEQLVICNPNGTEIGQIAPIELNTDDLHPIPEGAVNDPVSFYQELLAASVDIDALDMRSYAAYKYVTDHVKIVEVSD